MTLAQIRELLSLHDHLEQQVGIFTYTLDNPGSSVPFTPEEEDTVTLVPMFDLSEIRILLTNAITQGGTRIQQIKDQLEA